MVAVGAGGVPGELSKSPLRGLVTAPVGKMTKPNQMGRCRKWKDDGESDEEHLTCPVQTFPANKMSAWSGACLA